MIRGAFGRAFKHICCPFPYENGSGCPLGDGCPYGYVFETSPPVDARNLAKYKEVPHPTSSSHRRIRRWSTLPAR